MVLAGGPWKVGQFSSISRAQAEALFPAKAATEAALGRVDPGTAGASGQRPTIGPSGPAWLDEHVFNIKHPRFGAKGDGTTDDTTAIQAALTAAGTVGGTVWFPPGIYIISAPLTVTSRTKLVGAGVGSLYPNFTTDWLVVEPSWGYRASTIQYATGQHGAIFDGGSNCEFTGLVLRSSQARTSADVVFATAPSHFHFTDNVVQNMYAVADNIAASWGAGYIAGNQFTALSMGFRGVFLDSKVIDNTFTSLTGVAINLSSGAGPNLIRGNRFEWGEAAAIQFQTGSRHNVVTDNIFDAHATSAIYFAQTTDANVVANNLFWRNGRTMPGDHTDCHIKLFGSANQMIVNNTFRKGGPDSGGAWEGPLSAINLESCIDQRSTLRGNAFRNACTSSVVISDRYADSTRSLLIDRIDLPAGAAPGVAGDDLCSALAVINRATVKEAEVAIWETRLVTSYTGTDKVILHSGTGSLVTISNSGGNLTSIGGAHNITYGAINYTIKNGVQYSSAQPNGYTTNGTWPVGTVLRNSAYTTAVDPQGWTKTASGSPDTWTKLATTLSATATLDFPSVAAGATATLTITVTGAATGDSVYLGPPSTLSAGLVATGYVSAANTVTVQLANVTSGAIDPASATWRATVVRM